jgi:hypothetical protein
MSRPLQVFDCCRRLINITIKSPNKKPGRDAAGRPKNQETTSIPESGFPLTFFPEPLLVYTRSR